MKESVDKSIFVVTFPLITEKWQEDRIDKMMRILTSLYHDKQKTLLSRYIHLSHTPQFKEAKVKGKLAFKTYMSENGFSKFSFVKIFSDSTLHKEQNKLSETLLTHGLNSRIIEYLAHCSWQAWEKKLFGNGKFIKTDNEINIIKSRLVGGAIIGFTYSFEKCFISMSASKPKRHEIFSIPFKVNRNSEYELFAATQEVRNIAIVRKQIRGKHKYYVQFSFAGTPYNKGRNMGKGVVGIDPGPSKIAVVSDVKVAIYPLAMSITEDEQAVARLERKLDRSRRATNPELYNEDGTYIKGKKQQVFSKHYIETRSKLADSQRKLAAKRKIAHNVLANEIISLGNEFRVEDNSFRSMQTRAKETKKNANGKNISKRRFGKSLRNHAPAEFKTILENKVKQYPDGVFVDIPNSIACTQYDFTNKEFTKHELKERTIITSDGQRHNRDTLAAFNMKFVQTERIAGKKKIEKSAELFDNSAMAEFYSQYCELEKNIANE